jgi:glycosyltransferase involved in cell wall biosynthesis
MPDMSWVLITGEYPPQTGGVSDYTRGLAIALAATGDAVTVFAPRCTGAPVFDEGVQVRRLPDWFGSRGRAMLTEALDAMPQPRVAVLQYVAQSFGLYGCNIAFTSWLRSLRRYPLWAMFHEVTVTVRPSTALKYRIQAVATRAMAMNVIAASDAAFVSTPMWEPLLRQLSAHVPDVTSVPVPSNVPLIADPVARERLSDRFRRDGVNVLFGHFGRFRDADTLAMLGATLPLLLAQVPDSAAVLIGAGSDIFRAELCERIPALRDRLIASGEISADAVAAHIAACDLMLQPYEDGVTTRRSSTVAALALGVPVVTTDGVTTEAMWRASDAVALVRNGDAAGFVASAADLVRDEERRAEMSVRGRILYHNVFAIDNTVDALRARAMEERCIAS